MNPIIRLAGALLLAIACGAQAQNLSIATGGTGGVYYPMGGGMGALLSKAIPGVSATAEVTGGSVANLQLIGTGRPYLAFTQADAAIDALKGQDKFKGKPIPVRTLAVLYPNRMHVVTVEGSSVTQQLRLPASVSFIELLWRTESASQNLLGQQRGLARLDSRER